MQMTGDKAGHLGLLAAMAGFTVWFAVDAWAAQPDVVNMLLAGPVAALVLLLITAVAVAVLRRPGEVGPADEYAVGQGDPDSPAPPQSLRRRYGVAVGCAMLGVYVLSLEYIGFDLASFLFCALTMIFMGKRNWAVVVAYSAAMSLIPVYVLIHVMGVPVLTVLVR